MMHKTMVSGLIALIAGTSVFAAPWWDDFPRMVQDNTASVVTLHGSMAFNSAGKDPTWGTFFQHNEIVTYAAEMAAFANAGIKQIGYFETYGTTASLVAELGAWDEVNPTPVLHQFWSWQNYSGGTTRWLGAKDFFDDEDFARPFTRTHSRYGGLAMTYPDGTEATGYDGPNTDPRNSRVYDASCTKDILGELVVNTSEASGPTNGLVYIPERGHYAGFMDFAKDAACPVWTNYVYASTLQAADAGGDGMWTDNYGPYDSFGQEPVKFAFGDWSVARFRDHLNATYNSFSFAIRFPAAALNGHSLATLDVREYLKDRASDWASWGSNLNHGVWKDSRWLDDPMWREYLVFKRQTGTEALSNYYNTVKAAALEGGKPEFLVAGNDIPKFSLGWCRGDLDMVSTELSLGWELGAGSDGFKAPPVGRYAPLYKLGREHAKSRFVNVWLYDDGYETELSHPELLKVMYYEMLSTHTLPMFFPANPRVAGDETTDAGFFEFVEQTTPVFGDRVPVEDIGIYYSSSSILRWYTPGGCLDFDDQPHQFGFWGWGTALGELHYQYRAVPEWKLTAEMLATLRVLVIPNAEVLDPADVTMLQTWINDGGRLIITGDSGKYRGESGKFDLNSGGWSIASLTNHANVVYLPGNAGMDYYLDYNRPAAKLSPMETAMNTALAGVAPAGITDTTASSRTGITLYEDEGAKRFFIDVNNFNINNSTYVVTGTGTVEIEALCPSWLRNQRLQLSVATPQTTAPNVDFLTASSNDTLRIELGSVEYYAGVVIGKEPEWAGWQAVHFTSEEVDAGLANVDEDPDGDGFTNEQEYIAGSDPRDSASVFSVQISVNTGDGAELTFGSATGRLYSLFSTTDLVSGVWGVLETNMPGSGTVISVDDTNEWNHVYYRVEATRP